MEKEDLIVCFQDTLEKSNNGGLKQRTAQAAQSNRVYKEGFVSKVKHCNENASIKVYSGTTFDVAKKYCSLGKVAVLNFANPEHPGGGVQLGAIAQEECLCRSSNLYPCISDHNVFDEYYAYHRNIKNHFYSDRLIYTKDITVFKDDGIVPKILPEDEWFDVDVITCAAPYLAKRKYTNGAALLLLFKSRVKNIFEAARDNRVDIIILGAFGCGAFKNPPLIVAEAFRQVICEQNYFKDFKQIVFAIKPTCEYCPNLSAFSSQFDGYAPDAGERCSLLPTPIEWRFRRNPALPTESRFSKNREFETWQMNNKYFGKQFSVLGDSVSTLNGYNPKGYKVFYAGDNCVKTGVTEAKDTWWDKVIGFFGGELLVNNSWSDSCVTEQLFPSGCSDERTASLHINDVKPDVILVYIGTNDWKLGAKIGNETRFLNEDNYKFFDGAYDSMLKKLKSNYPESEIWCCTLCETYISKCPNFMFPHKYAGVHIEKYNKIIRNAVIQNNCRLIDLYKYEMAYDSIDGLHPTDTGMNTIATMIIRSMVGSEADRFLDCKDGDHEYELCDSNGDWNYYRCKKCGKEKALEMTLNLQHRENADNGTEYVRLDPNRTTVLYSDLLRLTIMSSGKTVQIQKKTVEVGCDKTCDLLLEKPTVDLHHATFFHENSIWFLCDNFSAGGTWLNGARMQPGKKYELEANDEINFAMAENMIFYQFEEHQQPTGNPDAKALAFLEGGMAVFAKSGNKDEAALKLIIAALSDAPLFFPVEIDLEAMFGSIDPMNLKAGDQLKPSKDVGMRILTLSSENGTEFVPAFTSDDEVKKGPSASIVQLYPQDYLPRLMWMGKPVVINPFSESYFLLDQYFINKIVWPVVLRKNADQKSKYSVESEKTSENVNLVGNKIAGRYTVLKLLGEGGIFQSYLVADEYCNKQRAMKVCDKKNRHYSSVIRKNILTEPYMMQKLNHPAIPKVVDIIENEDGIFIVRDYIEGETLETIARMYGAQPADKVIEWGKQMCSVLGYLHSQNPPLIYGDMKPANVILKPNGTILFIDFEIMHTYMENQNYGACCLGTKGYAAPEQYGGSQTDVRTDIYGLGVTMFRLVTGINPTEPPYEVNSICSVNPNLPKGLEYIISKCTQLNPANRYQSCGELMDDLNNYLSLPKKKRFFEKWLGKK